jgi:hypothetical protein
MQPRACLPSARGRESAKKLLASSTTAFAFAGVLAIVDPATGQEMQLSGPEIISQVETHAIAAADGSGQVFGVNKWIGAASLPGLFDSMQETLAEGFRIDAKRGQGEAWGSLFWSNNDGTMIGSYKGNATFTMNEKGQAKGSAEGTFEMTDGTGRFANVHGHGTWRGNFEGSSYIGQLNLTATGLEKRASRQ